MAKIKSKFDWRLLLLMPIPLLWALAGHYDKLHKLENILLDLRFRARGEITAPVKVFYADIDRDAVEQIGERPWDRAKFAEAARLLIEAGGAKGVGFDLVFSTLSHSLLVNQELDKAGNLALARLTRKYPQIVLAAFYSEGEALLINKSTRRSPLLRLGYLDREKNDVPELPGYPIVNPVSSASIGLIDFDYGLGGDETPRWAAAFAETIGPTYWNMGVQLACIELGVPPGSARRAGDSLEIVNPQDRVLRRIPVAFGQEIELNWFSRWKNDSLNPRTSLAEVLAFGKDLKSEDPAVKAKAETFFKQFPGTIVLIGPTDSLYQDLATTPFDSNPVPKVGAHGNLLKTIIAEQYLQRPRPWVLWVSVFGLTITVTTLTVVGGARGLLAKILAAFVLIGYVVASFYVFSKVQLVLPMAAPVNAAFTTGFMATIIQLIVEEKQKGRIKGIFSTYLAPTVVNSLIESGREPELGGHEAVITAYFSDIQSFSKFSELMPPSQLVELMNEYLTACTDIILEEMGTLDKYIGDAVVAMFGSPVPLPDHAYRACVTTIRVQNKIEELRQKWRSEGQKWPPIVHVLRARLGLNTGAAILGNMGSRTRLSYTMMGDNVNLAARMESGAKILGVYTMVADSTRVDCEKHCGDEITFRFLDKIKVVGKSMPVSVHEIVGYKEVLSQETFDCLGLHGQALERYFAQDWEGAIKLFERSAALEPNQPSKALAIESNPSLRMIDRCQYFRQHPPGAGWDGVFEMKDKG